MAVRGRRENTSRDHPDKHTRGFAGWIASGRAVNVTLLFQGTFF